MKKLTSEFNQATVRKGETFEMTLPTGGFIGRTWNDPQIVAGKATLVKAPLEQGGGCTGPFSASWTYKAEEVGDIEITAQSSLNETKVFKIRVI